MGGAGTFGFGGVVRRCVVVVAMAAASLVPGVATVVEAAPGDGKADAPEVDNIVGGTAATSVADFPHLVALSLSGAPACGGALIAPTWVMTAAHCFFNNAGTQVDFAGDISAVLNSLGEDPLDAGAEVLSSDLLVLHPDYDWGANLNDIALFRLTSPSAMTPTGLGSLSNISEWGPGVMATVKGWGSLSFGGTYPGVLHEVEVPIVSDAACEATDVGSIVDPIMLCAGNIASGGVDSCQGDSGGPLSVPDPAGGWITVGVVSFGAGCGNANSPGVYAEVAAFREWIAEQVPSLSGIDLDKTADVSTVQAGGDITYTLTTTNLNAASQTNVVVTDTLPAGTTYVAGSASCGGTLAGSVMTFNVGTLLAGRSQACSFALRTSASSTTGSSFSDGFEPDASAWTISHGVGSVDWVVNGSNPRSGSNAMFASSPSVASDQYLTLTTPVPITASTELGFWHRYGFEEDFDGGVVEISTDGTNWVDLGPQITQNGYDGTISSGLSSPIAGRMAFTGDNLTYRETVVDLSSFAGSSARIRFRLASDLSTDGQGWWIDDVRLASSTDIVNVANVTSATLSAQSQTVVTTVVAATLPSAPSGVVGAPGNGAVQVRWDAPAPGATNVTAYTVTATPGGRTCSTTGATLCVVSGLTNGTAYSFKVVATNAVGVGAASAASSPATPSVDATFAGYTPVGPDRAVDTREVGGGARVGAGSTLRVLVGSEFAGKSISVNLTVAAALARGFATLYACDEGLPTTSSLNYQAGQAIANGVITKVSAQGTVCVFMSKSGHVVLDVFGLLSR